MQLALLGDRGDALLLAAPELLTMERELLAASLTDRQLEQASSLLRRLAVSVRGD